MAIQASNGKHIVLSIKQGKCQKCLHTFSWFYQLGWLLILKAAAFTDKDIMTYVVIPTVKPLNNATFS